MGLIKSIKELINARRIKKASKTVGEMYVGAVNGYLSSIQIFKAVDRQLHKELFGTKGKELCDKITKEREELQRSSDLYTYLLEFLSKGTINKDIIKPDYEIENLSYHQKTSLDNINNMVNLLVNTISYSYFTYTLYNDFDSVMKEEAKQYKDKIFNDIDIIFKDKEKFDVHIEKLMEIATTEFGIPLEDLTSSISLMASELLEVAIELPDQIEESMLNRPTLINIDEHGVTNVTL